MGTIFVAVAIEDHRCQSGSTYVLVHDLLVLLLNLSKALLESSLIRLLGPGGSGSGRFVGHGGQIGVVQEDGAKRWRASNRVLYWREYRRPKDNQTFDRANTAFKIERVVTLGLENGPWWRRRRTTTRFRNGKKKLWGTHSSRPLNPDFISTRGL